MYQETVCKKKKKERKRGNSRVIWVSDSAQMKQDDQLHLKRRKKHVIIFFNNPTVQTIMLKIKLVLYTKVLVNELHNMSVTQIITIARSFTYQHFCWEKPTN